MNDSNLDPDRKLDTLFAQARAQRPDTSGAEYAFETRLMARLREEQSTQSLWAKVSWRMIPFFAACVIALAVWQDDAKSDANDALQMAYVENPDALEAWSSLN